ncbi:retrotransposon protein, putative, ty1-copia subclass [Tanacetum coccineum]
MCIWLDLSGQTSGPCQPMANFFHRDYVLSIEDKLNYLEQPLPPAPVAPAGQHVAPKILAAHTAWVKGSKEIAGLMLMTMEPEIQRNLENLHANDMLKELKTLFAQQAEQELLQTTRDFHACKQEEGQTLEKRNCPQYFSRSTKRRKRTQPLELGGGLSQTTLPKSFWDYALETAARILNMVPTKKVEKTPYEPDKLEPRSIKCIFIGYPKETMGYSFYYPPENKVLVARNAEFLENSLITQEASESLEDLEIIQEEDTHPSMDTSLHREEEDLEMMNLKVILFPIVGPQDTRPTDRIVYECGNAKIMKYNEVWILVELPPNGKTVGSKWFFKKKTDMDGVVHTYKARLVAKGYTQTPGIDYEETFSPVADIRAIRILIAIAAYYVMRFGNMMSKTTFLNGYLNEEVYMEQPEEFKRGSIPMQDKLRLSKSQGASTPAELKRMQSVPYASAVGSIMYDVRCTRPDVASR